MNTFIEDSNKKFNKKMFDNTHFMGIINVTPDSFSGDGLLKSNTTIDFALRQVERFLEEGATIIDIGGESTRPGAKEVSLEDEERRVIPIIKAIKSRFKEVIVSIDTTKSEIAIKALDEGINIINDVSGLMLDPSMIDVVKKYKAYIIIVHSNQTKNIQQSDFGKKHTSNNSLEIIDEVKHDLEKLCFFAIGHGVLKDNIIIDPGIGFGKTIDQNLDLICGIGEIKKLDFPVMLGISRKSFIGSICNDSVQNRLGGSVAANIIGYINGADILRVHDVKETVQAIQIVDAIKKRDKYAFIDK